MLNFYTQRSDAGSTAAADAASAALCVCVFAVCCCVVLVVAFVPHSAACSRPSLSHLSVARQPPKVALSFYLLDLAENFSCLIFTGVFRGFGQQGLSRKGGSGH